MVSESSKGWGQQLVLFEAVSQYGLSIISTVVSKSDFLALIQLL